MNESVYTSEMIAAAAGGDDSALTFLYNSVQGRLSQTVRSMIRDEDAVADIVQDSFIKGFRHLDQLDKPQNFPAWMRRIAVNTARDYMMKSKPLVFSELSDEEDEPVEFQDERIEHLPDLLLDQQESRRLIRQIVSGLSDDQQLAIGMYYFEDMSVREIASMLGCSENTVKSRLNYGRKNVEKKVRALEKQGVKLYSLAPLPFFLLLLQNMRTQPSQQMLQAILTAGKNASAGAAAVSAGAAAVSAGAAAAGAKVAGKAAGGLAAKIIAGVLAVALVGGGGAAAYIATQNARAHGRDVPVLSSEDTKRPEQTLPPTQPMTEPPTLPPTEPPTEPPMDPMEAYQPILDTYALACAEPNFSSVREQYPDVQYDILTFGENSDANYAFYDIDGNGVDELLFAKGSTVFALYGFDGEKAFKLVDERSMGVRSHLTIMRTGELYVTGSSGASTGTDYMVRIAQDGTHTEEVFYFDCVTNELGTYYYGTRNGERVEPPLSKDEFRAELGKYSELDPHMLPWKAMPKVLSPREQAFQAILDEYTAATAAVKEGSYRPELYPHTSNAVMTRTDDSYEVDFFYSYYDVDKNGTDELLIARARGPRRVPLETTDGFFDGKFYLLNVYTFDGTQAVQMFDDPDLGGTAYLYLTGAGRVVLENEPDGHWSKMSIAEDGYTPKEVVSYRSRTENGETVYYNDKETLDEMDFFFSFGYYKDVPIAGLDLQYQFFTTY